MTCNKGLSLDCKNLMMAFVWTLWCLVKYFLIYPNLSVILITLLLKSVGSDWD
jgi:hypothetical protein